MKPPIQKLLTLTNGAVEDTKSAYTAMASQKQHQPAKASPTQVVGPATAVRKSLVSEPAWNAIQNLATPIPSTTCGQASSASSMNVPTQPSVFGVHLFGDGGGPKAVVLRELEAFQKSYESPTNKLK